MPNCDFSPRVVSMQMTMLYTHLIGIINNNNNRPPRVLVLPYGTGNKVSTNDGLMLPGPGPGSVLCMIRERHVILKTMLHSRLAV